MFASASTGEQSIRETEGYPVARGRIAGDARNMGLPTNGPHPNAGRLFLDWLLLPIGQEAIGDYLYLHSIRIDAPPPPGGLPINQLRLLLPENWHAFLASRPEFACEWDRLTGMR